MTPVADASQAFIDKWLAAEAHWQVGQVFLPAADRQPMLAWLALLFELRETLFAASDPAIRQQKGAWWSEELLGWSRGGSRHPLGRILCQVPVDWAALAVELLPLLDEPPPDTTVAAAIERLRPAAVAAMAVESCWGGEIASADALARHWLRREWQHSARLGDLSRLPMQLRARHGLRGSSPGTDAAEVVADWGQALAATAPALPVRGYLRGLEAAHDARLLAGRAPWRPWQALWPAWQAARRAASTRKT